MAWFKSLYCPKIPFNNVTTNRAETLQKLESRCLPFYTFLEVLSAISLNVCCDYAVFLYLVQNVWLEAKIL